MVTLNSTPLSRSRWKIWISGMYVSVIAS